jgi:RNA polymerase sigma-70 factor (ECF subfamily)
MEQLFAELFCRSRAERFGFAFSDFSQNLIELGSKRLPENVSFDHVEAFYRRLRVADLALARGCANGNDIAWTEFAGRFPMPKLFNIARAFVGDEHTAREAAEGLYCDLYGVKTAAVETKPKLSLYSGEGSLEGWVSRVLHQNCLLELRRRRRLTSLDALNEAGVQFAAQVGSSPLPPAEDGRVSAALDVVFGAISNEDQFILVSHFADNRRMREIAAVLGVHESTISRRIKDVATFIRKRFEIELLRQGLNRREAEQILDSAEETLDVTRFFAKKTPSRSF